MALLTVASMNNNPSRYHDILTMDLRTAALDAMALLTTAPMNNNSSRYLLPASYLWLYLLRLYILQQPVPAQHVTRYPWLYLLWQVRQVPDAYYGSTCVGYTYYGRYGKFLMLQFNASGRLVGARVNTYLLEKASTYCDLSYWPRIDYFLAMYS